LIPKNRQDQDNYRLYISLHRQVDYVSFESESPDSKDNNKNSAIRACNPCQETKKGGI